MIAAAVVLTLGAYAIFFGQAYMLAVAVGLEISYFQLVLVLALSSLASLLPISISGLGVREGGLIMLLEPFGVTGATVVALSFLMLGRSLLLGAIGAALEIQSTLRAKTGKGNRSIHRAR